MNSEQSARSAAKYKQIQQQQQVGVHIIHSFNAPLEQQMSARNSDKSGHYANVSMRSSQRHQTDQDYQAAGHGKDKQMPSPSLQ